MTDEAPQRRPLVLSYWNVNTPNTGGLRRVNALLEALAPDVVLCQPRPPHPRIETVAFDTDWGRQKAGINRGLFNFFNPGTSSMVRRVVRERRPSVIVLTSIWTCWPVRSVSDIPIVLDAHDVLAAAMAERYGRAHPFALLVRSWEAFVARKAHHIFACSQSDCDRFIQSYGVRDTSITVIPNGVDLQASEKAAPLPAEWTERLANRCVLFFMGNPRYQPNLEGLKFLSEQVLPELERQRPGQFELVICGGEAQGTWHSNMIFAGLVPDEQLKALLHRADICLSPTFTGSGTRLKILEYLAAGKPVVSTTKGAEGLDLVPDRDLLVAEADSFAGALIALADSPDRARKMGNAGQQLVKERYDWKARIQPLWRDAIGRIARQGAA